MLDILSKCNAQVSRSRPLRSNAKPPKPSFPDIKTFSQDHITHSRNSKLTPTPQPGPIPPKHPHTHHPQTAQSPQQTDSSRNPQIHKQRSCKKDTRARQTASKEIVAGEQRGTVLRVAHGHIHKDALKDDKRRSRVDRNADHTRHPMDIWIRRPSEDKETDDGAEDEDQGGHEAMFLLAESIFHDIRDEVEVQVACIDGDTDETSDQDAQKHDADLAD